MHALPVSFSQETSIDESEDVVVLVLNGDTTPLLDARLVVLTITVVVVEVDVLGVIVKGGETGIANGPLLSSDNAIAPV